MNNLQRVIENDTRAAMHMAVELCEQGDFDSVTVAFKWLMQEHCDSTLGGDVNSDGLPVGLTISEDGSLLNWRGENYVRQSTLGANIDSARDALDLLEEMNEQGRIEYGDYSQLHDAIAATLGDGGYEAKMDALLCRLTNGKWSKSRAYDVDFMASCIEEEFDRAYTEDAALGSSRESELRDALNEVADKWAQAQIKAEDYAKENALLKAKLGASNESARALVNDMLDFIGNCCNTTLDCACCDPVDCKYLDGDGELAECTRYQDFLSRAKAVKR